MIPKSFKSPKKRLPIVTVTDISRSCLDFFEFLPAGQISDFSGKLLEISVTVTIGNQTSGGLKKEDLPRILRSKGDPRRAAPHRVASPTATISPRRKEIPAARQSRPAVPAFNLFNDW